MTASMSGWAVECTPPDSPEPLSYVRPCESAGHAVDVLYGLPAHYLPARVRTPEETSDGR